MPCRDPETCGGSCQAGGGCDGGNGHVTVSVIDDHLTGREEHLAQSREITPPSPEGTFKCSSIEEHIERLLARPDGFKRLKEALVNHGFEVSKKPSRIPADSIDQS